MGMNQEAFIEALLDGKKRPEIAAAAGVCVRTVTDKLKDPKIAAAIADERRLRMAAVAIRVTAHAELAADKMIELLETGSESIQLRAANAILEQGFKLQSRVEIGPQLRAAEEEAAGDDAE